MAKVDYELRYLDISRKWYTRAKSQAEAAKTWEGFNRVFGSTMTQVARFKKHRQLGWISDADIPTSLTETIRAADGKLTRAANKEKLDEVILTLQSIDQSIRTFLVSRQELTSGQLNRLINDVISESERIEELGISTSAKLEQLSAQAEQYVQNTESANLESSVLLKKVVAAEEGATSLNKKLQTYLRSIRADAGSTKSKREEAERLRREMHALRGVWERNSEHLELETKALTSKIPEFDAAMKSSLERIDRAERRANKVLFQSETAQLALYWKHNRVGLIKWQRALSSLMILIIVTMSGLAATSMWWWVTSKSEIKLELSALITAKIFVFTPLAFLVWYLARRIDKLQARVDLLARKESVAATLEPYRDFIFKVCEDTPGLEKQEGARLFLRTVEKLYSLSLEGPGAELAKPTKAPLPEELEGISNVLDWAEQSSSKGLTQAERALKILKEARDVAPNTPT